MNKSLKLVVALFTLSLLFNQSVPVRAAASEEDQFCDNAQIQSGEHWWYIKGHEPVAQTFTPTKKKLTSIEVALEGGSPTPAVVTMQLSVVGGGLAATQMAVVTEPVNWVTFTFPAAISMDTTKQYKINLTTVSDTARWMVSTVECYAPGVASIDGSDNPPQDFGFVTYGYNEATPTPTNPATVTPSKTPTPELIAKPNNLDAEYNEGITGVNLSWTPSATSDIDGYNIYRSIGSSSDFVKIASVENGTTEYIDISDIEPGSTYYYQVKAYKGDAESPASATVNAEVPGEDLEMTPTPLAQAQSNWGSQFLPFILAGMFLFAFLALVIVFLIVRKARAKKQDALTATTEKEVQEESNVETDKEDQGSKTEETDVEENTEEEPEEEAKDEETTAEE